MKKSILLFLTAILIFSVTSNLFSQSSDLHREFGLTTGAFTNFPCNKDYLNDNIKVINLAPYMRLGKHEIYAGAVYALKAKGIFSASNLNSHSGAFAGYKFYIFNPAGRENMYVNYAFQFLSFKGFDIPNLPDGRTIEKNDYINNVFSLGYVVYFDTQQRFGLYYTLGYVISLGRYQNFASAFKNSWSTEYILNNLSTNVGLSFKLKSFDKKAPKGN
jgi:hypothetical protein